MIVAELIIPKMFTAYAQEMGYIGGLHHYQYLCLECNQLFSAAWGKVPCCSFNELGSRFICPSCGKQHSKYVAYMGQRDEAPKRVIMSIKEYKSVVTFEVRCSTIVFDSYLYHRIGTYREAFRFDIARQEAYFRVNKEEPIRIGNPCNLDFFDKSILRCFLPSCLANTDNRSDLTNIIRQLRETVQRKTEKHLGHKVASMFVSHGYHGSFLLPLFNIAYRVTYPDAPNLPAVYRYEQRAIKDFWNSKMLSKESFNDISTNRKTSIISSLISAYQLPDKPMVRRILTKDLFDIKLLKMAFDLCDNYDNAINLYYLLPNLFNSYTNTYPGNGDFVPFLREVNSLYGEVGMIRLLSETREYNTGDCINLYNLLNDENKEILRQENVRLRDLHDWLSLKQLQQRHVNVKFDVPEHIVRRLSMQSDRLNFFMPQESMDLLKAGHQLHNCVASYGAAMKDKAKWIVLVADDKGKLAACLEIKGKELLQAKVDRNRPVACVPEINSAILAWAQEAKIKISTPDVKVPVKNKSKKKAIPA